MYSLVRPSGHRGDEAPWCVRSQMYSPFLSLAAGSPSQMAWISSEFCLTCVEIKFYGAFAESSRRPPRHRRDACSMARQCRFLTARRSQDGRVIAECECTRRTG